MGSLDLKAVYSWISEISSTMDRINFIVFFWSQIMNLNMFESQVS